MLTLTLTSTHADVQKHPSAWPWASYPDPGLGPAACLSTQGSCTTILEPCKAEMLLSRLLFLPPLLSLFLCIPFYRQ